MLKQSTFNRVWSELNASYAIKRNVRRCKSGKYNVANPWRVGLIGCGRIARRHTFGYLSTGSVRLVAGADPNPKKLSKAVRGFGLETGYLNFSEMLKFEELDIVSICAPPRFHAEAITQAVKSGVKGILCEKPLALDLEEADKVLKICQEANVKLAIGHQRRYSAQHKLAKKILEDGEIGQARLLVLECPRDILRAGIHAADFLRFYGGEVNSVTSQIVEKSGKIFSDLPGALLRGFTGDKHGLVLVNLNNDTPAVIRIEDRGGNPAKIQILGQNGEIEVWFDGGLRYRKSNNQGWQTPSLKLNPYLLEFRFEIENLMKAIQKNEEPLVGGQDGRKSLEIILAILKSSIEGKEITLPLPAESLVEESAVSDQ